MQHRTPSPPTVFRPLTLLLISILLPLLVATSATAQQPIQAFTDGMEKRDGYLPLYWDGDQGRLYMEISRFGEEFYYLVSLATGIGSNPLGLDRGEIMEEYIARFERNGPKVLFVLTNPRFGDTDASNEALTRAVVESFPT